jgi:hypothetical protein
MDRSGLRACLLLASAVFYAPVCAAGQPASPLSGIWSLNRGLSEFPKEIGFNIPGAAAAAAEDTANQGGRGGGRRGSGNGSGRGGSPFFGRPESYDDSRRIQLLIADLRNPPQRLNIVDTPAALTITNELGQPRTLHATGREESFEIQGVPFTATTSRDGERIVTVYHVAQGRDVRYTISAATNPTRLVVEAQLIDGGKDGDKVTRVYNAGIEPEPPARAAAAPAPPPGGPPSPAPAGAPASAGQPASPSPPGGFDQRPGAEFRGLKTVGILVEDFGQESIACGLNHDTIQDALSRRLSAGGLTVRKNSDDDTYVYVNVITTVTPNAGCVSRYDAFLYTHATARLAYHEQPVLVQVSLIHRGGIGASATTGHAGAVSRGLEGYIDVFLTQIRDANK